MKHFKTHIYPDIKPKAVQRLPKESGITMIEPALVNIKLTNPPAEFTTLIYRSTATMRRISISYLAELSMVAHNLSELSSSVNTKNCPAVWRSQLDDTLQHAIKILSLENNPPSELKADLLVLEELNSQRMGKTGKLSSSIHERLMYVERGFGAWQQDMEKKVMKELSRKEYDLTIESAAALECAVNGWGEALRFASAPRLVEVWERDERAYETFMKLASEQPLLKSRLDTVIGNFDRSYNSEYLDIAFALFNTSEPKARLKIEEFALAVASKNPRLVADELRYNSEVHRHVYEGVQELYADHLTTAFAEFKLAIAALFKSASQNGNKS